MDGEYTKKEKPMNNPRYNKIGNTIYRLHHKPIPIVTLPLKEVLVGFTVGDSQMGRYNTITVPDTDLKKVFVYNANSEYIEDGKYSIYRLSKVGYPVESDSRNAALYYMQQGHKVRTTPTALSYWAIDKAGYCCFYFEKNRHYTYTQLEFANCDGIKDCGWQIVKEHKYAQGDLVECILNSKKILDVVSSVNHNGDIYLCTTKGKFTSVANDPTELYYGKNGVIVRKLDPRKVTVTCGPISGYVRYSDETEGFANIYPSPSNNVIRYVEVKIACLPSDARHSVNMILLALDYQEQQEKQKAEDI